MSTIAAVAQRPTGLIIGFVVVSFSPLHACGLGVACRELRKPQPKLSCRPGIVGRGWRCLRWGIAGQLSSLKDLRGRPCRRQGLVRKWSSDDKFSRGA